MTTTTKRPEWAAKVLADLMEVGISGTTREGETGRLTRGELLLLDGIAFRVRGRLGELSSRGDDMCEMGNELLRAGMAEITPLPRKPARRLAWPVLVAAAMGTMAFFVLAAVDVAVGDYVQAALWGLLGAGYGVMAGAALRASGPRRPKPPVGEDGAR